MPKITLVNANLKSEVTMEIIAKVKFNNVEYFMQF